MSNPQVKPQAGSGGLNLRSTHQVDPSTLLGTLKEGSALDVVEQSIAGWYGCQLFASTQVFEASGKRILPLQHPAAILHDPRIEAVLVTNYHKLECLNHKVKFLIAFL